MRQPELVDIVDRRHPAIGGVIGDPGMGVAIDEARRHPFAAAVDLVIDRLAGLVAIAVANDLLETDDAAVLDDDVHRPDRRRTGAVDHGSAAQRQPLEGADAAVAIRRLWYDRRFALVPDESELI